MKAHPVHVGAWAAKPECMDNNITNLDNKLSFSLLTLLTVAAAAIMAKLRSKVEAHFPEGYEDEGGFHFGQE
jgi:hypothetical protein